jgi:hypothetical protein
MKLSAWFNVNRSDDREAVLIRFSGKVAMRVTTGKYVVLYEFQNVAR